MTKTCPDCVRWPRWRWLVNELVRLGVIAGLLLVAVSAWAVGPVVGPAGTAAWGVSTDPDGDLAGYEVLIGTAAGGPYTIVRDVGLTATPSTPRVTIGSLALGPGQKYAVVRAYDGAGNRSGNSNEVPFVFGGDVPGVPPSFTITP